MSHIECQPCANFTNNEIDLLPSGAYGAHQCPDCGGIRWLCGTCKKDHHEKGWCHCLGTQVANLRSQLQLAIEALERIRANQYTELGGAESVALMALAKIKEILGK